MQRLWDWATGKLDELLNGIGDALPLWVLLPALLVLVAVIIYALAHLRRRDRPGRATAAAGVLADTTLTAEQLRRRANHALSQGDSRSAVLDLFRAIARSAEERALVVPRPGRTAHEVGLELAPFFPGHHDALLASANLFDRVRYGGATATADDVAHVRSLDDELTRARPQHVATAGTPA
nr:DUF4129 domain-containing protein [Flexivirga meconopsidis]